MDGWMDGWMNGCVWTGESMGGLVDEWMDA